MPLARRSLTKHGVQDVAGVVQALFLIGVRVGSWVQCHVAVQEEAYVGRSHSCHVRHAEIL